MFNSIIWLQPRISDDSTADDTEDELSKRGVQLHILKLFGRFCFCVDKLVEHYMIS